MFNTFRSSAVSAHVLELVAMLFAATAVMAGYPSAVSAHYEPADTRITGGK
jgi:hypothetical protein